MHVSGSVNLIQTFPLLLMNKWTNTSSQMDIWDWIRANEDLCSTMGLSGRKSCPGHQPIPLKIPILTPQLPSLNCFVSRKFYCSEPNDSFKQNTPPWSKHSPPPTGQKYSVTCWPIHWLANTLAPQKSSSAHLRVLTYEREYTVEARLWSLHFGELLLACKIKTLDDRVTGNFFLDVRVNTD